MCINTDPHSKKGCVLTLIHTAERVCINTDSHSKKGCVLTMIHTAETVCINNTGSRCHNYYQDFFSPGAQYKTTEN